MKQLILPVLLVGMGVGCTGDYPSAVQVPSPTYTIAGRSGCYTVSGLIEQSGLFPVFAGTISGDIEGSVTTTSDPASLDASGKVSFSSGEQTWKVTGGSLTALIGGTVRLAIRSEVAFAQFPVGQLHTTARVIEGAASGNLSYHGTFDVTLPPPFHGRVEYHGVVCP